MLFSKLVLQTTLRSALVSNSCTVTETHRPPWEAFFFPLQFVLLTLLRRFDISPLINRFLRWLSSLISLLSSAASSSVNLFSIFYCSATHLHVLLAHSFPLPILYTFSLLFVHSSYLGITPSFYVNAPLSRRLNPLFNRINPLG